MRDPTEVSSPVSSRSAWGEPQILHPATKADRTPYRFAPETWDHYRVTLRGRHVADVRHASSGGWELFTVERPEVGIAWAGNMFAMETLASEALPAQESAAPGCYAWCVLVFHKVEVYTRSLTQAVAA